MASEGRLRAARAGGLAISQDREHMAALGRRGGQTVSRDRAYMAEIGARGGARRRLATNAACGNCGRPRAAVAYISKGRCPACYLWRRTHGAERPATRWGG